MRVLVIGGTGFLGRRLCARFMQSGAEVEVLALAAPADMPGVRVHACRRDSPRAREVLSRDRDVVVDLIAYHPEQTASLLDALRGCAARLVHLSTAGVYRRFDADFASETQTERFSDDGPGYGARKAACERVLEAAREASGFPSVIIRPVTICGPGDPVSRENYLIKRILAQRSMMLLAPLDGFVTTLFVDDLIDALVAAAMRPGVVGGAYHLSAPDCPTIAEHVRTIALLVGAPLPPLHAVPVKDAVEYGFSAFGFPYTPGVYHRLDCGAARRDLGIELTSYAEATSRTVSWFRAAGATALPAWPGSGTTQSRLAGTDERLHAALERRFLHGYGRPDPLEPDDVLEELAQPGSRLPLAALEPWSATVAPGDDRSAIALAPRAVREAFSHAPAIAPDGRRGDVLVAAVFAPLSEYPDGNAFLLSTLAERAGVQVYGHASASITVHVCGFASIGDVDPGERERVVLTIAGEKDASAYRAWMRSCNAAGAVFIESLERWSRICLPVTVGYQECVHWGDVAAIAKLLTRAGIGGAVTLRIRGGRADAGTAVARASCMPQLRPRCEWIVVNRRPMLVDLARRRLFEVTTMVVEAIEATRGPVDEDAAIALLSQRLALSADAATRLFLSTWQQLASLDVALPGLEPARARG